MCSETTATMFVASRTRATSSSRIPTGAESRAGARPTGCLPAGHAPQTGRVDPDGEARRVPPEVGDGALEGEPVGHPADVGHRRPHRLGAAGGQPEVRAEGVGPVGEMLDEAL